MPVPLPHEAAYRFWDAVPVRFPLCGADSGDFCFDPSFNLSTKHPATILGYEDRGVVQVVDTMGRGV